MVDVDIALIIFAGVMVMASPGPATLAIAGTSMSSGRQYGLSAAFGITTGSIIWSIVAALGLGALMASNVWAFELLKYLGAAYLLFLAFKSGRSAFETEYSQVRSFEETSLFSAYIKGLALHLTNPKAILFFGSLYSIGIPHGAPMKTIGLVILTLGVLAAIIFLGYALLFSNPLIVKGYLKLKRWFEAIFAAAFGVMSLKILTTETH